MATYWKKTIILTFLTLFAALPVMASGFMEVRNFPRDIYKGGPQNWDVIQDSVGNLYVGNRDGMLSFDGERWHKYVLPNLSAVRTILYDKDTDRIYVGGSEEFGYFSPHALTGALQYTSLLPTLRGDRPHFTEIWNIHALGGKIWFQGDFHLFCYDGNRTDVTASPDRISCSALIGSALFVGFEDGDIGNVAGGGIARLNGTTILAGKKIQAILPGPGMVLVCTPVDGIYGYDGNGVRPYDSPIDGFLRENQLLCAVRSGDDYVFGTVTGGAVVRNHTTGATRYINRMNGLQNNTVLNAGFDKSGNIWLCLDNGLDYAIYNSPLSNLIGSSNDVGAGYASLRCGDRVYFGTNQGLYSTPYPFESSPRPLALRREFQGQVWDITECDGGFFVAGDAGAYVYAGGSFEKIAGLTGTHKILEVPGLANTAIASCYDGFHLLRRESGRWHNAGIISGAQEATGEFHFDNVNNLWFNHWIKGIYRLHYDPGSNSFDVNRLYTETDGLPGPRDNAVTIFNGRPIFTNDSGFYTYDYASDSIVPDSEMATIYKAPDHGSLHFDKGRLVLIGASGINVASPDDTGSFRTQLTIAKSLKDRIINGFENVNVISPDEVIVANQDGFWSVNPKGGRAPEWEPAAFVGAVYANTDSLVYLAGLRPGPGPQLKLPHQLNSLRFEFSCPDFQTTGGVLYSSYLEHYDKDWSPYTTESSREYTQLHEGTYTLHLRAYNRNSGEETETSFPFRITPPWHRSIVAMLVYSLLFVALVICLAYMLRRWKLNTERRAEKQKEEELSEMRRAAEREALQKDYEISKLKSDQLEVDVKHKSTELSNATMNLIRKNEILHEIASKIAKIQELTSLDKAAQRQLSNIQASIKENISHDDDQNAFNRNFDIVYGDYTKRLRERYPQLTPSDVRLACYLKMGLSSKEIAPLVNISYKSVEMARYRLRKKMGLDSDTSITDYLANF